MTEKWVKNCVPHCINDSFKGLIQEDKNRSAIDLHSSAVSVNIVLLAIPFDYL